MISKNTINSVMLLHNLSTNRLKIQMTSNRNWKDIEKRVSSMNWQTWNSTEEFKVNPSYRFIDRFSKNDRLIHTIIRYVKYIDMPIESYETVTKIPEHTSPKTSVRPTKKAIEQDELDQIMGL